MSLIDARRTALNTLSLYGHLAYFDFVEWLNARVAEQLRVEDRDREDLAKLRVAETAARALFAPHFQPYDSQSVLFHEEFYLVPKHVFTKYASLPSFEELQRDGNLEVFPSIAILPHFLFVSHRWFSITEPDSPDRQLLALIRDNKAPVTHVWIDYCCIPQNAGAAAIEEAVHNLDRFVSAAAASMTVTFDAGKLLSSGWCFLENSIIPENKGFILVGGEGVVAKEWEDGVRQLNFTVPRDGPVVLSKALKHTYAKALTKQLAMVRATTKATVDSPAYREFETVMNETLIERYKNVARVLVRNFKECYTVGGIPALRAAMAEKLVARTRAEPREIEVLQLLMRHPACVRRFTGLVVSTDAPDSNSGSVFGYKDWERVRAVDISKLLEGLLNNAMGAVEIGFMEEPETVFSFRRIFPRALGLPPMIQILSESDNNMYIALKTIFKGVIDETTVDDATVARDVDLWTDAPGNALDSADYVQDAASRQCTSYHVTMRINDLQLYEPVAFAVRVGRLTDLNMRTRPLITWKHIDTAQEAIDVLRNAEFIRAGGISDKPGVVNTFVVTNLDEISGTLDRWEGWGLVSLLIEMAGSIKMNGYGMDEATLAKYSPKTHALYLFTVWQSPYYGFEAHYDKFRTTLWKSFRDVFPDTAMRQSLMRLMLFGALLGTFKSHAPRRGGPDRMLESDGDHLLEFMRHLTRPAGRFQRALTRHRAKYMTDFVAEVKRAWESTVQADRERQDQAGGMAELNLLAQLLGGLGGANVMAQMGAAAAGASDHAGARAGNSASRGVQIEEVP